jgi:hypothetical protein
MYEDTRRLAEDLLAGSEPTPPLLSRAADLQARQRSALDKFKGVPVRPEDNRLLESVGKTWVRVKEVLQATEREKAAESELARQQARHEQVRNQLTAQSSLLDRANFEELTRALEGTRVSYQEIKSQAGLNRAALRAAIGDMAQVADASEKSR